MLFLPLPTWIRFIVWLAIGLVVCFRYSQKHSRLAGELLSRAVKPSYFSNKSVGKPYP